jgi:hypothetical protein
MKMQLFVAMMAMASLLFLASGANANNGQNCPMTGLCGNPEVTPAGRIIQSGSSQFTPAVPSQKQESAQFTPAGSSISHKEYVTPKNAPYQAPGESQYY